MIPQHVSIIMDGNGRWAVSRGLDRTRGHLEGIESVRCIVAEAVRKGVGYLSLYAFSEENWNRPTTEVQALMALMAKCMVAEEKLIMDNNVRFRVIGNLDHLELPLRQAIAELEEKTASNPGMQLLVMLSYSGRWDIAAAASKYGELCYQAALEGRERPPMDITLFDGYLATSGVPDPDLLIRTSGEMRLSNYMLWQCAYTEFYITDTLWPDFREKEFNSALEAFSDRDRRFGKVK